MKKVAIFLLLIFVLQTAVALDLSINKTSSKEVIILGVDTPVEYNLTIKNNENKAESLLFYTFFGAGFEPVERINFNGKEEKEIKISIIPREDYTIKGYTSFSYFIKSLDDSEIEEKLMVKIIDLDEAFEIGASKIDPESNSIYIYLENKINFNFENLDIKVTSPFFGFSEKISLEPYESKEFEISLDNEEFQELMAGFYTLNADIGFQELDVKIEGNIEFLEKDLIETKSEDYGFIIVTKVIEKTNNGNVVTPIETTVKKNALSRLFTSFNEEPSTVKRQGLNIYYTWISDIAPGETSEIKVRTNWLIPLLILLAIYLVVYLTKRYYNPNLILRKRVSFVRAKGGEFALKVSIIITAKQYLEKVRLIDRLPPLVKMYERFGGEYPSKVDEKRKKIEWEFNHLEEGEKRIISYVIYSKVGILGRFALPSATAIFEREGKIKDSTSNKAFFVAEQKRKQPRNDNF
jgi:hypothetical protein